MNIAYWLQQTARSWPKRVAILHGIDPFATYAQLAARTSALAYSLAQNHGIGRGDRVAIFARNGPECIEIMHAVWWLGAVVVPVNCKLHPGEAAWIAADSGAGLMLSESGAALTDTEALLTEIAIGGSDYKAAVESKRRQPLAEREDDDPAWLFYTSGTTGRPKGVILTHGNLIQMSLCYTMDVDAIRPDDVSLYAAPMSHGAGLYSLPFIRAGARHLMPRSRGFNAEEILALAADPGDLCFFAPPTMVKRLVETARRTGLDGTGIKTVVYGGGPMYAADIDEALDVFGARFVQIYGQGESPMTITALSRELVADETHPNWRERRASVGTAQSCIEVAVVDDNGERLAPGETGEVAVRGPTVMKGYWNDAEATAKALVDGWLMTGDLGHLDRDGFLTLTDRSKDVIISGGTNIYPREVEEVLLHHPAVFEAAVIGAPDPEWGERVIAFLVMQPDTSCTREDLDAWCKDHMASFKKPRVYQFIDDMPKNSYGKILKSDLRRMVRSGASDRPAPPA